MIILMIRGQLLPPTSDAAKYHSYRAYYQVQQWLGNELPPTEWGWTRISQNENLVPVVKDKPAAPQKVLKLISCGCKQGCNRNCKCRKAGLLCTPLCSGCNGTDCTNSEHEESDAWYCLLFIKCSLFCKILLFILSLYNQTSK